MYKVHEFYHFSVENVSSGLPTCTLWLPIFISETSVTTGSNEFFQRLLMDFLPLKYCKLNYVFFSDHCITIRILTLIAIVEERMRSVGTLLVHKN